MEVALIPCDISDRTAMLFSSRKWWLRGLGTPHDLEYFIIDCSEEDGVAIGSRVFRAPIAQVRSPDELQYGCLVLQQLDIDTYRRIGFCCLTGRVDSTSDESDNGWDEQNQSGLSSLEDYVIPESS